MTDAATVSHRAWNWDSIPKQPLGSGIVRQMIHGERLMVCRLTIAPGTVTNAHEHVHEQMTMVERGRVRFVLGSEERVFGAGDVLFFPSGFRHGAMMLDEEVVLIDIFTPVRQDFLGPSDSKPSA